MFDFKEKYKACFDDISGSSELKQKLLNASCEEKRKTYFGYYRAAAAVAAILIAVFGIFGLKPGKDADIAGNDRLAVSDTKKAVESEKTGTNHDDNLNKENEIQKTEENNSEEKTSEKSEKTIEKKKTTENQVSAEKSGEVKKIPMEEKKSEKDEPKEENGEKILAASDKETLERRADTNSEDIVSEIPETAKKQTADSGAEESTDEMPRAKAAGELGGGENVAMFSAAYNPFVPEFYSAGEERVYVSREEYFKAFGKSPFKADETPFYEIYFLEQDKSDGAEIIYPEFGAFLSTKPFSVMHNGEKTEKFDGGVYETEGSVYCFKKTDRYYVFLYSEELTGGELKKLSEGLTK